MSEVKKHLEAIDVSGGRSPLEVNQEVTKILEVGGYELALHDYEKPWGGFSQLENTNADRFIDEFFPGLSPEDARLGNIVSPLSPKILVVAPNQRLSWQFHDRRAERWAYLNEGAYFKSMTDEQGELRQARAGEVVQFARSERHRLVGAMGHFTLVAEIWQHSDPRNLSNEFDITRLEDDYTRR